MAANRIYVGNLPSATSEDEVEGYFRGNAPADVVLRSVKKLDLGKAGAVFELTVHGAEAADVAAALNGGKAGRRKVVASTDRNVVINHEEQYS